MFEFKFNHLEKLTAILQAVAPFEDVCFNVDSDRMKARRMGKNLGQMVDLRLSRGLFDEYRFHCQSDISIAFDVDNLLNIVKKHSGEVSVVGRWKETEQDKLELEMDKFKIIVQLITTQNDELEIPDRLYDMELDMHSATLQEIVNKFSCIDTEVLEFQASYQTLSIKTKSSKDNTELCTTYDNGDDVQWRWNSASGVDDFSIGFSFNGIKEFAKAKKLADLITIKISQMCPLCATYALDNDSYVSYYLAPREL